MQITTDSELNISNTVSSILPMLLLVPENLSHVIILVDAERGASVKVNLVAAIIKTKYCGTYTTQCIVTVHGGSMVEREAYVIN
jgi:hypothetical protein